MIRQVHSGCHSVQQGNAAATSYPYQLSSLHSPHPKLGNPARRDGVFSGLSFCGLTCASQHERQMLYNDFQLITGPSFLLWSPFPYSSSIPPGHRWPSVLLRLLLALNLFSWSYYSCGGTWMDTDRSPNFSNGYTTQQLEWR